MLIFTENLMIKKLIGHKTYDVHGQWPTIHEYIWKEMLIKQKDNNLKSLQVRSQSCES